MSAHLPRADTRYTITMEHCGYVYPRHVLRFCDAWVSSHETLREAEAAREHHKTQRETLLHGRIA